jgi:NADH:ubiquinone oxidoreductase subunit 5 (subunit L)/multisubunit Na+/H+ antiporter MnhA subunit
LLSLLLLVFILSLAGIPPLGGFFGKFYLFAAAVQRDAQTFGLLWLVILGILMSAAGIDLADDMPCRLLACDTSEHRADRHPDPREVPFPPRYCLP